MTLGEIWLVTGMALVTFGLRYPLLALLSRVTLPARWVTALQFIPPAVLAAIIVPAVFAPRGRLQVTSDNAYLIAAVAAALIAWRTRNLLATITVGMALFLLWRYTMGSSA